jgi:hypothetical protein
MNNHSDDFYLNTAPGMLAFQRVYEASSIGARYELLPSTHRYIDLGVRPEASGSGGGGKGVSQQLDGSKAHQKAKRTQSKTRGKEFDY